MNFSKYKSAILTLAISVWIIFPFVILAFFNFPSSDDYYDWMLLQKFGALKATWHYYFNWSGRYFTHFIAFLLNPLQLGERLGGSFSALLGITFLVIDAFLVSGILKATFQFRQGIQLVFIAFLILFFCYLPFPNETVFWFTGMIAYMPGFTACLYWMFLQLKADKNKTERILWFVLPAFAGGSGELSLCLMGWLLVLNINYSSVHRAYWILCGLFGMAAGIELLAPGSAERIRYFTETAENPTQNIAFAFSNSAMWLWHFLRDWTRSTPVLMMALVCGALLKSDSIKRVSGKICFLWSLGLLVPFAMLFIFHFGTGMSQPPNRLINVVYLFLQVFLFISIVYIVKQFGNVKVENGIRLLWFVLIVVVFQAGYSSRWRGAVSDFPVLNLYSQGMQRRLEQTKQAHYNYPSTTLILKPVDAVPFTSFFSELSDDSSHWYNEGYAAYHGIRAVRCMPSNN